MKFCVVFFLSKKSRACNLCYQKYTQSDALSTSMISRLQEEEGPESEEEEQTSPKVLSPPVPGTHCFVLIKTLHLVPSYNFPVWYTDYTTGLYFIDAGFKFLFIKSLNHYTECLLIVFSFNLIIMLSYMDIIPKKGHLWCFFLVN